MALEATILSVLLESGQALKFDDVVKGVAEKLEDDIRATLNDLADKEAIIRHVGGRDHSWRYQALPIKRRV